jgi:hypothetical protein
MNRRSLFTGTVAAGILAAITIFTPSIAQNDKVKMAMESLKSATLKLGSPRVDGTEAVSGKNASALFFGNTRINNTVDIVDAVVAEHGGTATLFAKTGREYVRVSTNVPKPDGSGRATGTILDPAGKAIVEIDAGKPFYGEVAILGTPYITGYEPIKDASGNVIGIWYVGYKK